jgi:hypothetical protein
VWGEGSPYSLGPMGQLQRGQSALSSAPGARDFVRSGYGYDPAMFAAG